MFNAQNCWICQKKEGTTTLTFDTSHNMTMFLRHCDNERCVKAAQKRAKVTV